MRDLLSWNLSLGRWAGVHVRLHVFFILFALAAMHFSLRAGLLWYGVVGLSILLIAALAHEIGHCAAARWTGGTAEQILLWPLGGLAHVNITQNPAHELVTALAGPLVNLAACLALMPLLAFVQTEPQEILALLNPLAPPLGAGDVTLLDGLRLGFWINWLLLLINLLPAFPLDGARALRAWLWQTYDYRTAMLLVVRMAKLSAVGLLVVALLVRTAYPEALLPLALFGVFLYFSAKQEGERAEQEPADGFFGYDFSQGYTSLERGETAARSRSAGPLRRWLEARREARLLRQRQIEEDEERRVDEILARLHEVGIEGLSAEDRALLDRVSARYRNRQRSG